MSAPIHTKFSIAKWSLYVLFVLFIFSPNVPSSSAQQKIPAQTEQRDEARPIKTLFRSIKFQQPVSENGFLPETSFFSSLFHCSNAIEVSIKNRTNLTLLFAPLGINLLANVLPRSYEESYFLNPG